VNTDGQDTRHSDPATRRLATPPTDGDAGAPAQDQEERAAPLIRPPQLRVEEERTASRLEGRWALHAGAALFLTGVAAVIMGSAKRWKNRLALLSWKMTVPSVRSMTRHNPPGRKRAARFSSTLSGTAG